ncbi:MAG: gamma-glutamyltransferase [Caldilineaceae bacterium]|nr:gamma-glutamyltransferase [Caldilineaceae bacterium]MDE0429455.1 gamma-glutamyltransferase [Caldilineaceae bacterium]
MIASAHPLASVAGLRILIDGGNAVDAAVAVAAALNVVEPYMSGLGGDGYMHIYSAREGEHKVLDYMGRAPYAATFDEVGEAASRERGPRSPIIPGACGGWLAALERYGTMDAAAVFQPAIEYAEQGFPLTVKNAYFTEFSVPEMLKYPSTTANYLPHGRAPLAGELMTQPDLANSMRAIAEGGAEVFYSGDIADKLVRYMEENGGLITSRDLTDFAVEWQEPVSVTYRGYRVFGPPPPCQAVQYLETLNIMEGFDVAAMGHNSAATLHRFIEAAKLAQADRAEYAGVDDPPTSGLLDKEFAAQRRAEIGAQARPSGGERFTSDKMAGEVLAGDPRAWMRSECTTHFSVADAAGNAVGVTQSLGAGYGSAVVVPGTGIALNNFLYWMDSDPQSPNAVGPGRKLEMCMSPAQVWDDQGLRFLIGTPGSYGILQTTPQMMMNVIDHGMNIQAAIEAPRVKATAPGTLVDVETRIGEDVLLELTLKGHRLNRLGPWAADVGGGQGIMVDPECGGFMGGADPRRDGYALGW